MLPRDKGFKSAKEIKDTFAKAKMTLDGVSAHCPVWVQHHRLDRKPHDSPVYSRRRGQEICRRNRKMGGGLFLRLLDLCAELGVKIVPMFWGVAFGWELATGYPWGFWKGGDYDLLKEGQERFVKKTAKIRQHANKTGHLSLAHEIHPGTAAMCADDFNMLVEICDGDKCLGVNADPSHCWEGRKLGNTVPQGGFPHLRVPCEKLRHPSWLALANDGSRWQKRAMQFVDIPSGDLNMSRYVELLIHTGYPATLLRGHGYKDRSAGRRGRKRLPRSGCDQRQWHPVRARQSLFPACCRFVRRRHGSLAVLCGLPFHDAASGRGVFYELHDLTRLVEDMYGIWTAAMALPLRIRALNKTESGMTFAIA